MIKKVITSLIFLFVPLVFFTGWNYSSNQITSFYYYKDQPFDLTIKSDRIFVKLKNELTSSELTNILSGVTEVSPVLSINESDTKHFITLNSPQTQASIVNITRQLSERVEIEYVSPVFSPDNGTTLIGVENEVIVQFKSNVSSTDINSYINSKGLQISQILDLKGGSTYVLTVPQNSFSIDVANDIHNSGLTNWSEPNLYFTNLLCYTPNDPLYANQWSLNNQGNNIPTGISGNIDCDMDVDSAWNLTLGHDKVIVAISDTGVDTLHEDLAANMVPGTGFNFFNNTPGGWDDGNHGTACAGIVAGIQDNNIGVSGVAPNSKMIPVKWMNSSGSGNYTGATNATIWSYQKGAWVISNSWGFVGGASSALDNAILDAVTLGRGGKGSVFVVASGNENGAMRFPASTNPNCLVVGGISPCNQRKSTSSCDNETWWGASFGSNLHVVAPCVKITTTDRTGSVGYSSGNYAPTFNGTSSATPNVAGVCALVFAADSNQTWDTLRARITRFAEKRGSYTYNQPGPLASGQWNNQMGYGLVNAYAVLNSILGSTGSAPAVTHTPVVNSSNINGPYLVSAFIIPGSSPVDSLQTKVFWSRDGAPMTDSLVMFRTDANTWIANIPGNGTAAEYRYYIKTKGIDGFTATHPVGAPAVYHSFEVADTLTNIVANNSVIPKEFALSQNFPNPFNPATKINFDVPKQSFVTLKIYDISGREIALLANGNFNAGVYTVNFDASQFASGTYFYRIEAGDFVVIKKMMLVK